MKILLRALPYILFFAALYAGWYYWQQRPKLPLAAALLHLDLEDIDAVNIDPTSGPAFEFDRVDQGWLVSSGHYHRLEASQRPNQLLQAFLDMQSIDVAPAPLPSDLLARISLYSQGATTTSFDLYQAADTLDYRAIVRFGEQPDFFALADFDPKGLPLAFGNYRSYELLDFSSWPRLDSLAWRGVDSTAFAWSRPLDSLVLDSLYVVWHQFLGKDFADHFDEIGDQADWYGSYHLYGATDSLELRVYYDSLWPQPYVLNSDQFPKAFFGEEELPLDFKPAAAE